MTEPADTLTTEAIVEKAQTFANEIDYARKAEVHLWTVLQLHVVDPTALTDDTQHLVDDGTLRGIQMRCYLCRQSYEPRLQHRKCKADRA